MKISCNIPEKNCDFICATGMFTRNILRAFKNS